MAAAKPILVTGATGKHGGTGNFLVQNLLKQGLSVRAIARSDDERAQALRHMGVEVFIGDLQDRRTLLPALTDVETAYFTYPVGPGIVDAAVNFVSAAKSTGLKRLVVMSMAPAHPQHPSPLGRGQWLADELFEVYGFNCIILRIAALFFENLDILHGKEIASGSGVLHSSFANIGLNWISGKDCAELATQALLHPEKFAGSTIVYSSGGSHMTYDEAAQQIGQHLKKKLRHETISQEQWEKELLALIDVDKRMNVGMAAHISRVGANLQQALPKTDVFEKVTGHPAMTLEEGLSSGYISFSSN